LTNNQTHAILQACSKGASNVMNEKIKKDITPPQITSPKKSEAFSVNTYTILKILEKMRHELGLEAMIEYLEMYLMTIESDNPKLKMAVSQALTVYNTATIYEEAMKWKNRKGLSG
jgi:hypothetical protein